MISVGYFEKMPLLMIAGCLVALLPLWHDVKRPPRSGDAGKSDAGKNID